MSASAAEPPVDAAVGCPMRKLTRPGDALSPAVGYSTVDHAGADGEPRWVVRSFRTAREVMRNSEAVRQAGFGAEAVERAGPRMRPPILYLEGEAHRDQRRAAARLFAPKVTEAYREMMEELSERLVGAVPSDRPTDLSQLSLQMAVSVAARVVGLTNSSLAGMTRRLDAFFEGDPTKIGRSPAAIWRAARRSSALLRFFYLDVKPAIRARRRKRADDVISVLLDAGFSDADILTECVTYGAAGMATTREFITVAVWHLLDNRPLLDRYRRAETDERLEILNETLRLEPVVGHLYRRTAGPLSISTPDGPVELPAGSLIDIDVRAVNADRDRVGGAPLALCPSRDLPRTVPPSVMSFGDGHHRCPGGPLAIMETEIFVTALLRNDVAADGPPRVRWNEVTQGYDLDRYLVRRLSADEVGESAARDDRLAG